MNITYLRYSLPLLLFLYSPSAFAIGGLIANLWEVAGQMAYDLTVWVLVKLTYLFFAISIAVGNITMDVVAQIWNDLQLSQYVNQAFSALPPEVQNLLNYLKVGECLNQLLAGAWVKQFRVFMGL